MNKIIATRPVEVLNRDGSVSVVQMNAYSIAKLQSQSPAVSQDVVLARVIPQTPAEIEAENQMPF